VAEFKVSPATAREIYGVAIAGNLEIDREETRRLRAAIRDRRRARAGKPQPKPGAAPVAAAHAHNGAVRWNDNLAESVRDGHRVLQCRHCGYEISHGGEDYESRLAMVEGKPEEAGPQVCAEPWRYIDAKVVFRQYCCPGCATAFVTQVVPENHPLASDHTEMG
jgi:N-methylhydantoinase B